MSIPYLIAHLSHGEPIFDVAYILSEEGTPSDPGPWWITSAGHRVRPYAKWYLEDLVDTSDYPHERPTMSIDKVPIPEDHPDFHEYSTPIKAEEGLSLLAQLGLLKTKSPISRRV